MNNYLFDYSLVESVGNLADSTDAPIWLHKKPLANKKSRDRKPKKLDMDQLLLITQGHAAFRFLNSGAELGLYNYLDENPDSNLKEISAGLKIKLEPCQILLTGLASLGVVIKKSNFYRNAKLTKKMLVEKNNPQNMVPILGWQKDIVYPGLVDFTQSLKENKNVGLQHFPGDQNIDNLYARIASDPDPQKKLEHTFQDAMCALSKLAHAALIGSADFTKYRHLVDVGGGNGTNAIAFAKKFPHLKITIFDSASVCKIAQKNIRDAGLESQIGVHAGDIFSDALPLGIDAILYSHMLTIWSPDLNTRILKKSYMALPKDGSVFIFNMMGNDAQTGPVSTALGAAYFLGIATGKGNLYSWQDYTKWISKAGFEKTKRIDNLNFDHGIFIATK